jgi:hypothetical protein
MLGFNPIIEYLKKLCKKYDYNLKHYDFVYMNDFYLYKSLLVKENDNEKKMLSFINDFIKKYYARHFMYKINDNWNYSKHDYLLLF